MHGWTRRFHGAAASLIACLIAVNAFAQQEWPARPVRLIVPWTAKLIAPVLAAAGTANAAGTAATSKPAVQSQSSGAGAGKVTFNPFSITRKIDRSSPTFY